MPAEVIARAGRAGVEPGMMRKLRDPSLQRALFKRINVGMMLAWRLGLGRMINAMPGTTGRIMVIVTVGRRSGRIRRFPINYAREDGQVYCLAGFGSRTHWYRNVIEHPEVELWLPDGRWIGRAEPLSSEQHLPAVREVLIASGFASRVFEGIDAWTVTDAELRALADRFPLVRITMTERVRGRGPADLAWLWPAAIALTGAAGATYRARRSPSRPYSGARFSYRR